MPKTFSFSRSSVAGAALALGLLSVSGCAATTPSGPPSVGQALRADPRFSDFVQIIDFAGLGHRLDTANNVTIFAPTNAAFDTSDPSWRTRTSPQGTNNFDLGRQAREQAIRGTVLMGIHPPADFIGKVQDIDTLGGQVFHVNGMVQSSLTVTAGVADGSGMGFPAARAHQTAQVGFPPITTASGLIYPIDTILR